MQRIIILFFCLIIFGFTNSIAQGKLHPDSTNACLLQLREIRQQLISIKPVKGVLSADQVSRMLKMGVWNEAYKYIRAADQGDTETKLLWADYYILQNDFKKAENYVNNILGKHRFYNKALLLQAFLEIQSWRLPMAVSICDKILKRYPADEDARLMKGRALLLQKNYSAALNLALDVQKKNPVNAGAYQLEADVYFWDQHPEKAEAPLLKSLEIDPYNADARFSYGYAIWRRVDATQLNAMAAQWEIALAVNPLHYQTHWHWGNGHTNLTFADYAEKEDESVRDALKKADSLVRFNKVEAAIEYTRQVEKQYPSSVLPLLHRGSLFYSAFDMYRPKRLDSAQQIFETILFRKKHFGPAHNGLSAVIKSKRIAFLAAFDSINNALYTTLINDPGNFEKVFPDLSYYAGNMAKAMVWKQMYASVVYFPFLSKQGNSFKVPPLHIDLATCMNAPYFRFMTTFDNRQWMDIRGVGSGAAAIEYVERGAFLERNVVLHEYVHLFHYSVLTDDEQRAIRKHYYTAMQENRTLDYYSRNNESEYFAQTYPAYFEPVKVHPLDFKSMNTTSDLKTKDPGMYQFLDKMVKKQVAYMKGDKKAMAGNWSQVYVNLSNRLRQKDKKMSAAYLDSAMNYDNKYLPVYISYAQLKISDKDYQAAEAWLDKAAAINMNYGPLYASYAELASARQAAGELEPASAIRQQAEYLQKALKLEDDFQEKADMSLQLSETYRKNGWIAEAIQTAEEYEKNGATVSTYLRDKRDDAAAYAASLKSFLGYSEPVAVLKKLVEQKPQNYEYRNLYADALAANRQYKDAIATLLQAQRILASAGNARADYNLRIAEYYHAMQNNDSAKFYLDPLLGDKMSLKGDQLRFIRLLAGTGNSDKANVLFRELAVTGDNFYLSEYYYSKARLEESSDKNAMAADYEKAIGLNPYDFNIYNDLLQYYSSAGLTARKEELKRKLAELKIKPGPVYSF